MMICEIATDLHSAGSHKYCAITADKDAKRNYRDEIFDADASFLEYFGHSDVRKDHFSQQKQSPKILPSRFELSNSEGIDQKVKTNRETNSRTRAIPSVFVQNNLNGEEICVIGGGFLLILLFFFLVFKIRRADRNKYMKRLKV